MSRPATYGVCEWPSCQQQFKKRKRAHRFCSRVCANRYLREHLAAHRVEAQLAANLAAIAAGRNRTERAVRREYGELSVREIELFNLAVRVGYKRGYQRARYVYSQRQTLEQVG